MPRDRARAELPGGPLADERTPFGRVLRREQRVERHVGGVPVVGLAVGEGELLGLEDRVRSELARGIETLVVDAVEDAEHLQQRGSLPPGAGLRDRHAAELRGDGRLIGGPESGQILRGQDARVVAARRVPVRRADEVVDRPRDEPLRPLRAGGVDAGLARRSGRRGHEALEGSGERSIGEQGFGIRDPSAGHPELGRARPVLLEEPGDALDRRCNALEQRMPVARVADREGEHVGELPGPVVAQEQQPGVDRAGDRGGEGAGAGDEREALRPVVIDRGTGRRRPLAHEHDGRARGVRGREDAHEIAARSVEVGLDDVQHEGAGDRGVEGVASAFEHGLAGCRREPVRRGRHAEASAQGRAGGEARGRGVAHPSTLLAQAVFRIVRMKT